MTYAGRLDPMATGKILVLIGDECARKSDYTSLDKEYVFEVLLGLETDTGDILGLAESAGESKPVEKEAIQGAIDSLPDRVSLPYPIYSSKHVDGKPLFQHARDGTISDVEIPERAMRIYDIHLEDVRITSSHDMVADINARLGNLSVDPSSESPYKDFRVREIRARWSNVLGENRIFTIARVRAVVSSGTYVRSIAPLIARRLGTCGLAYTIHRTRIGTYVSLLRHGFWLRSY